MHALLIDFEFIAYSVQLANALSELCQVTLMLPQSAPADLIERVEKAVDLRQFRMPRLRQPANVRMVDSLFRAIAQARPDVVHQLAWHLWMNVALPFLPPIPLVTTIHDASRHPGDRQSITWFQSWQWRKARRVIVHAEAIKRQLVEERRVPDGKVHVIPLGSYDLYRQWARGQTCEQHNTVLFFGRIWEYKGLRYLIEAEPLISAQVPDVRIVIAGQGEPFAKYQQMMANPDHFVVHNYHVPDEMIARLFQEASVVALPYTEASQSAVLAIAYAFGRPVVATTVGGIPEVLDHGETGFLVPPRDPDRLAEAIVTLLQDDALRRRMGHRAREKAESELSWPTIARQTLEVYREAIAARAAGQ